MTPEASINQPSWSPALLRCFPISEPVGIAEPRQEDLSNQQEHFDSVMIDEVKAMER